MTREKAIEFVNSLIEYTKRGRISWSLKKCARISTGNEENPLDSFRSDETNSYVSSIDYGYIYLQGYISHYDDTSYSGPYYQLSVQETEFDNRHLVNFEDLDFDALLIRLADVIKIEENKGVLRFIDAVIREQFPHG